MKFKDCLLENTGENLYEETGLKTAKKIQKHFGGKTKISSTKWSNHDYNPAPKNERHTLTVPVHRDEVKKHLVSNGWKLDPHDHVYHHPEEGARHTVEVRADRWDNEHNTSRINVFKTNHKGSMATY